MAHTAVARGTLVSLRREIARIEGRLAERLEPPREAEADDSAMLLRRAGIAVHDSLPLGVEAFDRAAGGGIPRTGLTEIHAAAMRDVAAASGFALALALLATDAPAPILWIATAEMLRETGRPYAPGLVQRFGLSPARLLFAEAPKPVDALWIAEEAASAATFSAILVEIGGEPRELDLTATRRLHRRALTAGQPMLLLRAAAGAQPTAAPLRLVVGAAPSSLRNTLSGPLQGSIGPPAFNVSIGKSRTALPASVILEWIHGAFHPRHPEPPALPRAVVPLSSGGEGDAPALRPVVAHAGPGLGSAARLQPAREQHPARRRAGRAR